MDERGKIKERWSHDLADLIDFYHLSTQKEQFDCEEENEEQDTGQSSCRDQAQPVNL